jgi:uncharacterized protein YcsI (UPF0317 family)
MLFKILPITLRVVKGYIFKLQKMGEKWTEDVVGVCMGCPSTFQSNFNYHPDKYFIF